MPKVQMKKVSDPRLSGPSYPTIYIQANEKVVEVFKTGDAAEVVLRGKIVGLYSSNERHEIQLELREVIAYPDDENEFEKMARDDEEEEG